MDGSHCLCTKEKTQDRSDACPQVFILLGGDAGKLESIERLSWVNHRVYAGSCSKGTLSNGRDPSK